MKRTVRCISCSKAATRNGCGFTAAPSLVCTERGGSEVSREDGCTFGRHGRPGTAVDAYDVTIGGHEAVRGRDDG